jgi:glycosyltransferase involved in cell wall biosynthesis
MRLLLVNMHGADTTVGGAERYVADLARGLTDQGATVSLLAAFPGRHDGPFEEVQVLHDVDWRESRARRLRNHLDDALALPSGRLERAVAAARPDLVHTGNLPGITTSVWEAAARRGVPVVHTLHDYYLLCPRSTLVRADGRACRPHPFLCGARSRRLGRHAGRVGAVVGVSRHLLERHDAFFPAGTPRHVVLHPVLPPATARTKPPGDGPATLGYLGSLDVVKGVGALLEALPALAASGVGVRFAGDGRLRGEVERAAATVPGVEYLGVVSGAAKDDFLASCDAGLAPSVWAEPGAPPFVAVEWLGAGRPLLAGDRGGFAEAAPRLPGLRLVEPTAAGIVEGVRRLRDGGWPQAVADARAPVGDPDDADRWLDEHLAIYRAFGASP